MADRQAGAARPESVSRHVFGGTVRDDDAVDVVDLGVFAWAWAVHTRKVAWLLGAG